MKACICARPSQRIDSPDRLQPLLSLEIDKQHSRYRNACEPKDRIGPFEFHFTTCRGDATRLARLSLLEGVERVVCVGGDGTLNEIVNGFMGEGGPIRPAASLITMNLSHVFFQTNTITIATSATLATATIGSKSKGGAVPSDSRRWT